VGRRRGAQRGAVLVEFTAVVSVLLIVLLGIVEFGFLMNARLVITSAAREGARRAAVEGGATPAVMDVVRQNLAMGLPDADRAVISIQPYQASYGTPIHVRISYRYAFMTPLARALWGQGIELVAEYISRGEKVRARQ